MAKMMNCRCGSVSGVHCRWKGPKSQTVVVEWMPEYLRASHKAANNRGSYPWNGAERVRVSPECANDILDIDPEWSEIV